jgi:hypothetical protein
MAPRSPTTLPGLWAIGDTTYAVSAWAGAAEAPPGRLKDCGLMNALMAALMAVPSVVRNSRESARPTPHVGETLRSREKAFAPLKGECGYSPSEALRSIQKVLVPVRCSLRRESPEVMPTRHDAVSMSVLLMHGDVRQYESIAIGNAFRGLAPYEVHS